MAKTKAPRRTAPAQPHGGGAAETGDGRRVIAIVAAVLAIVVGVYVSWSVLNDPQRQIEQRTAELRQEQAVRNRAQIQDLTAQARELTGDLAPVVDGMGEVMPPGEEPAAELAEAATVAEWEQTVQAAAETFAEVPSGSTGVNVARSSLAIAVDQLAGAVETYTLALDARGDTRTGLVERAAEERDLAVRSWSVGATQLDQLNVDAGYGHQHVYLEAEGTGALTADGAEEGQEVSPSEGAP